MEINGLTANLLWQGALPPSTGIRLIIAAYHVKREMFTAKSIFIGGKQRKETVAQEDKFIFANMRLPKSISSLRSKDPEADSELQNKVQEYFLLDKS